MSRVALANYIRFKFKDGSFIGAANYQNFFVSEVRAFNGVNYQFAPFRISGNISNKGGDNAQASLTTIPNALTVGLATESVLNAWMVQVSTLFVTVTSNASLYGDQLFGPEPGSFTEGGIIATEIWMCGNMSQDYEKITIGLLSPLDAARQQIPKRVLSETLIGSAPPTGFITGS